MLNEPAYETLSSGESAHRLLENIEVRENQNGILSLVVPADTKRGYLSPKRQWLLRPDREPSTKRVFVDLKNRDSQIEYGDWDIETSIYKVVYESEVDLVWEPQSADLLIEVGYERLPYGEFSMFGFGKGVEGDSITVSTALISAKDRKRIWELSVKGLTPDSFRNKTPREAALEVLKGNYRYRAEPRLRSSLVSYRKEQR